MLDYSDRGLRQVKKRYLGKGNIDNLSGKLGIFFTIIKSVTLMNCMRFTGICPVTDVT